MEVRPWAPLMDVHTCVHPQSLQLCPILCDSMDCSPTGSSVYGILQAKILEWVAMPSSRGLITISLCVCVCVCVCVLAVLDLHDENGLSL